MPDIRVVGIGEYLTAQAPVQIAAYGLGSCAGVAIYDTITGYGALAHSLLPSHPPGTSRYRSARYTDIAIQLMLEQLIKSGCATSTLVAKLAGGAAMYDGLYREGETGIGERNTDSARETLVKLSIPIAAEDIGGTIGRSMVFDLKSGLITIRTLHHRDTIL